MYYCNRRKKIRNAATEAWPGNSIPLFNKGSNASKILDSLVDKLCTANCSEYFNKESIRKHVIDTLAERRRQIKKGHNYDKVTNDQFASNSF